MPPYPITNFEMENHCQNHPKFNGIFLRNNLLKLKYGAYIII